MSESMKENKRRMVDFFNLFLSRVDDNVGNLTVVFTFSELEAFFNMTGNTDNIIRRLYQNIMQGYISYVNKNGEHRTTSFFENMQTYKDKRRGWCVKITANKEAYFMFIHHIKDPRNEYIFKLASLSAIRLYDFLSEHKEEKNIEISVDELRMKLLVYKDKYWRWDNFKRKILDAGRSQINEITDLEFSYERGKTGPGGKWETIIFHITDKS